MLGMEQQVANNKLYTFKKNYRPYRPTAWRMYFSGDQYEFEFSPCTRSLNKYFINIFKYKTTLWSINSADKSTHHCLEICMDMVCHNFTISCYC